MAKYTCIVIVLLAVLVTSAQAAQRDVVLVSRASGAAGAAAGDVSLAASSISASGRYVAFVSLADNLSEADDDAYSNVFVRDLQAHTTTYVSRDDGEGSQAAHGFSSRPSISADGRLVAFDSAVANLSEEDDSVQNLFVRDLREAAPAAPATSSPSLAPADTSGPAVSARSLTRANGTIRVSRAGRRVMVGFRLPRPALRRLAQRQTVRMRGTLTVRDALGNATTVGFRFMLKRAR